MNQVDTSLDTSFETLLDQVNLAYNTALTPIQRLNAARAHRLAPALPSPCEKVQAWAEAAKHWLEAASEFPRWMLSIRDPHYPTSLHALKDPPLIIFGEGEVETLHLPAIAMVGSRNSSRHGLQIARDFAKTLGEQGWGIVSGLAEGIDGAAHAGALDANSPTLAVLGGAVDRLYPKSHNKLAWTILKQGGAIISEYPPGTEPQAAFFPRRNRIIAALSDGVLVVEAALKSGSLITARVGSEIGRPVMAIPGSIHSTHSKGCHEMIKKGALLIETSQEVIAEARAVLSPAKRLILESKSANFENELEIPSRPLKRLTGRKKAVTSTESITLGEVKSTRQQIVIPGMENELVDLLVQIPFHPTLIDELIQRTRKEPNELLGALTELELDNWVVSEAGNRWQRLK